MNDWDFDLFRDDLTFWGWVLLILFYIYAFLWYVRNLTGDRL